LSRYALQLISRGERHEIFNDI